MLGELLSAPPAGFIFHEPRIGIGKLRIDPAIAPTFAAFGIDIVAIKKEMRDLEPLAGLTRFKRLVDDLAPHIEQIGVKEITHTGAVDVSKVFPDMRVVVTVRDPRDIYLSLYHRRKELLSRGKLWFETKTLLPYLREQTSEIFGLMERHAHTVVRYEDVCNDPSLLDRVREFVGSPVHGVGLLGTRGDSNDRGKHGKEIDATRVALHSRESDEVARHNAQYIFEEMGDYAERFGYA